MSAHTARGRRRPRHKTRIWLQALAAGLTALSACADDGLVVDLDPDELEQPALVAAGGSNQADTVLATLAQPLRVQAVSGTTPAQGAVVRWRVESLELSDTTDALGFSEVAWTLGPRAGEKSARAWLEGDEGTALEFRAVANPGQPVGLLDPGGLPRDQAGLPGAPLLFDLWTAVADAHGNVTSAGGPIVWGVTAGGGSIEELTSPWPQFSFARLTLGPSEGANQVSASAPGVPGSPEILFDATAASVLVAVDDPGGFHPDSVSVTVGQSVAWIWGTMFDPEYDYAPSAHDVVFEQDPGPPMSSGTRNAGSHVVTFSTPGLYRYRCTAHSHGFISGQMGIVVVSTP